MKNIQQRKQRAEIIIKELKRLFPKTRCFLHYKTPWELLVAVILSAQCTDKRVNIVTKDLFKKYKTLDDYVNADIQEFEQDIRSTGFYKNKAKNILAAAKIIKETHKGKMPKTLDEMVALPGVGRKTAHIVLGNVYGLVEGIAVDTHVKRIANKYGLTTNKDPNKIEQNLMEVLPKDEWFDFTNRVIEYGRTYCPAKKHDHENCPLVKVLQGQAQGDRIP